MNEKMNSFGEIVDSLEQQAYGYGYGVGETDTVNSDNSAEYLASLLPRIRSIACDVVGESVTESVDTVVEIASKIVVSAFHYGVADGVSGNEFKASLR